MDLGGGIAAGSFAAIIQSGIGNVAANSAFAIGTSLGMKGYFIGAIVFGSLLLSSCLLMLNWKKIIQWFKSLEIPKLSESIFDKMKKGWNYFFNNIINTWKTSKDYCYTLFQRFFH